MASSIPSKRQSFEEKYPGEEFFEPVSSIAFAWKNENKTGDSASDAETKQLEWKQFCAEVARNATRKMEEKSPEFATLNVYFSYFAAKRAEIALRHKSSPDYGLPQSFTEKAVSFPMREIVPKTKGRYSSQYEYLKEKVLGFMEQSDPRFSGYIFQDEKGNKIYDIQIFGYGITGTPDNYQLVKIPYSRLVYSTAIEHIFTAHVKPTDIIPALIYTDLIYRNILSSEETTNKEKIKAEINDLTYQLYNIVPLMGGSSSATLMLELALLHLYFIPAKPNVTPISPDFKAFASLPRLPNLDLLRQYNIKLLSHDLKSEEDFKNGITIKLPKNEKILCRRELPPCPEYPLSHHPNIPFERRFPNAWRADVERLILNNMGKEGMVEHIAALHTLYFKIKPKLKAETAAFLSDPENFFALFLENFNNANYLIVSESSLNFFAMNLNFFDSSQLQAQVDLYKRSQKIFDQIDTMPYFIREIFTHTLHTEPRGDYEQENPCISHQGNGYLCKTDCDLLEKIILPIQEKVLEMKVEEKDVAPYVMEKNTMPFILKIAIDHKLEI